MGNCIRHESSVNWAGDDWGCLVNDMNGDDGHDQDDMHIMKKQKIDQEGVGVLEDERETTPLGNNSCSCTATTIGAAATEVKIKITKKQLEELLGRVDVKQMSVQQVLAQLIKVSDRFETHQQQRSWRPALQSIPEVN